MRAGHRLQPPGPVNTKSAPEPQRGHAERRLARGAAATSLVLGLGFGLPCAYGLWYFATRYEVWTFVGFPTYGGGRFEANGIPTTVPLLIGFLIVCALEVATGALLWKPHRAGYWIAILLIPFETVYWIGFDLPFGPLLGIARTVLVIAALWSRISARHARLRDRARAEPVR